MKFYENNKYLFGAYFNTAFDNFNDVLKHIFLVINLMERGNTASHNQEISRNIQKDIERKPEDIRKYLSDQLKKKSISAHKIEDMLKQAFPFWDNLVSIFIKENTENKSSDISEIYIECIEVLSTVLNDWRNYTTHYYHDEGEVPEEINKLLYDTFDDAIRIVRERFFPTEEEISHLRIYDVNNNKNVPTIYSLFDKSQSITEKGLALFVCLFLNKGETYNFLKSLKGFKRDDDKRYRITLEVFTVMRFRAPKRLMKLQQKSGDKISLAMDMIGELAKCPKELYDCISEKERKEFEFYSDENDPEAIGDMIRYKDRYEILAMKALEYSQECKDMGFYMNFGKCYMNCYKKTFIDGTKDNRYITFPLYGFGRIQNSYIKTDAKPDIESDKDPKYLSDFGEKLYEHSSIRVQHISQDDINQKTQLNVEVPYISESYPSYVINDNKIGIKRLANPEETIFPRFNISDKKVSCPLPDYWLSRYELPAMAFYVYLKDVYKERLTALPSVWELIENDTQKHHKSQYDENYIRKIEEDRLNNYRKEIDYKIDQLTKENFTINNGKIADELARDILWLQPSVDKGKNKLTGANFQVLQYALARYSYTKEELAGIFQKAGLTGSDKSKIHPFLGEKELAPSNHTSLESYYMAYLSEKKIYIETQIKKIEQGKTNINFHPFRKLIKGADEEKISADSEPIFLSRNLFAENIKKALCIIRGDLKKQIESLENNTGRLNASILIQVYFFVTSVKDNKNLLKEDKNRDYNTNLLKEYIQPVYQAKRGYYGLYPKESDKSFYLSLEEREKKIAELKKLKERKKLNPETFDKDEFLELSQAIENEKKIRLRVIQDITLYLWMNSFIQEKIDEKIRLSDLKNSILSKTIPVEKSIEGSSVKIKSDVKIKDYGRFFSVVYESLPYSLISFISSLYEKNKIKKENRVPLSYDYIFKEINTFIKYRSEIINLAQSVEQKIIGSLHYDVIKEEENYYNFSNVVNKLEGQSDINVGILISIRNGFCHNYYSGSEDIYFTETSNLIPTFSGTKGIKEVSTVAYYLYNKFKIEQEKVMKLE